MTSFVSVEIPRRTPDGCFGDDRILLHTNARFQTVDSSGKKKKKEKSPPIVWMSYIIDRGWGRRKKSAADLLETRQPRKPESTFFQQGRERSNHSYPSFGGMRNRATWNLHSPQTSTYWTPVRLEAGMSFSTGGTSSSSTHVYSRPGAFAFGAHPDRLHRNWRGL